MSNLPILDQRAAFVDVGSEQMHVSIAGGQPEVFDTVTSQLHALRDSLLAHEVRSVAMEATGVYWLPLYGVPEAAGLQVLMVNGRQTAKPATCPGARRTCRTASGTRRCMRTDCCVPASCRRRTFGAYWTICACVANTSVRRLIMSSTCKRRWSA